MSVTRAYECVLGLLMNWARPCAIKVQSRPLDFGVTVLLCGTLCVLSLPTRTAIHSHGQIMQAAAAVFAAVMEAGLEQAAREAEEDEGALHAVLHVGRGMQVALHSALPSAAGRMLWRYAELHVAFPDPGLPRGCCCHLLRPLLP